MGKLMVCFVADPFTQVKFKADLLLAGKIAARGRQVIALDWQRSRLVELMGIWKQSSTGGSYIVLCFSAIPVGRSILDRTELQAIWYIFACAFKYSKHIIYTQWWYMCQCTMATLDSMCNSTLPWSSKGVLDRQATTVDVSEIRE